MTHVVNDSRGAAAPQGPRDTVRNGAAPHGMWWVAWRQHRAAILTAVGLMAALAVALVLFRIHLVGTFRSLGCSVTDMNSCASLGSAVWTEFSSLESQWRLMHGVMIAAPIVLGVFLGAPVFSHEFSRGTHVLALTQSVRRTGWWATKLTVVAAPLLGGLVGLGYLTQWMDHSNWLTHRGGLAEGTFQVQSVMPATFGLLAFSIAATAGIVLRSTVGSLVAALFAASAIVLVIAFPLRPHLVPTARAVTPIAQVQVMGSGAAAESDTGPNGPNALFLDSGLLDAQGRALSFRAAPVCDVPPPADSADGQGLSNESIEAFNEAIAQCRKDQGIVSQYVDYIPGSMLWPLRGVVAAICVILAALFLGLGAWRLPKAIARR